MQSLVDGGLIEDEIAERYRMTTREVRQQLAAVEFMDRLYFPITADPTDAEHRTKFSYFLEFLQEWPHPGAPRFDPGLTRTIRPLG